MLTTAIQERPDLADLTKAEGHPPLEVFRKKGFDF
jgi:hypothetical protein